MSCLGFLCLFVQKHAELRKSHETDTGLAGKHHGAVHDEQRLAVIDQCGMINDWCCVLDIMFP